MKRACLVFALAACASEPEPLQYTGPARRFAVDAIALPLNNTEARAFGADLNGDRTVDNQLGMVISTLSSISGNVTTHGDDMIAAGVLASSVVLVADDLSRDDTVALRYFGADGDEAELIDGALASGRFTTRASGAGAVHLPVFVDSDPIIIPLVHMRASLVADGRGGYDATIQGAVPHDVALAAAYAGITQMFESRPSDHVAFFRMLDTSPYDFTITRQEFDNNTLIASLMAPDLDLDGEDLLSIGFRVHLSPCAEGNCVTPAVSCFDRARNGNETDVDCGGACGACESQATCFDGVKNGLETDVDCGTQCGACATGRACWSNSDCTSKQCGEPCSGTFCNTWTFDTCK